LPLAPTGGGFCSLLFLSATHLLSTATVSLLRGAVCTGCAATHLTRGWHTCSGCCHILAPFTGVCGRDWTHGRVRLPFNISTYMLITSKGHLYHSHPSHSVVAGLCVSCMFLLAQFLLLCFSVSLLPVCLCNCILCSCLTLLP
jgi:hypothetical protein